MNAQLKKKIKKVKFLVLDVDGVLTNGQIVLDHRGQEMKYFDVQDGLGIVMFQQTGYEVAIISSRQSGSVKARAKELNIHKVFQGIKSKEKIYKKLIEELAIKDQQICFIGDDLPDLSVLKKVGFAVTVPNGAEEVKEIADYVTRKHGGQGAVREVIELILKTQGHWDKIIKSFS